MGKVANNVLRGLEEALAYADGKTDVARYGVQKACTKGDSDLSQKNACGLGLANRGRISRR